MNTATDKHTFVCRTKTLNFIPSVIAVQKEALKSVGKLNIVDFEFNNYEFIVLYRSFYFYS